MADMVAGELGRGGCEVVLNIPDIPNASYNPTQEIYMNTQKLNALGWSASKGLREMYERMMACM